ncbi:hypothetical protein, partial [Halorubrum sp. ASP1]|uniref:hypothetical protein n=1 Tax=Halorubrum sp. ASP1 TaxID=2518114 RepID=UPI001A7E16EE
MDANHTIESVSTESDASLSLVGYEESPRTRCPWAVVGVFPYEWAGGDSWFPEDRSLQYFTI